MKAWNIIFSYSAIFGCDCAKQIYKCYKSTAKVISKQNLCEENIIFSTFYHFRWYDYAMGIIVLTSYSKADFFWGFQSVVVYKYNFYRLGGQLILRYNL